MVQCSWGGGIIVGEVNTVHHASSAKASPLPRSEQSSNRCNNTISGGPKRERRRGEGRRRQWANRPHKTNVGENLLFGRWMPEAIPAM